MSAPIPILPDRQNWSSAIGLFIIDYGTLDWLLLVFLDSKLSPDEFAKIKNRHFKDRVEQIKSVVDTEQFSAEQRRIFGQFFVRLDPVRELRNHIAHGHLLARFAPDGKTLVLTLALPKDLDAVDSSETRRLEFSELTNALNELTALIENFQKLSGFGPDIILNEKLPET